eukprot:CAMPEP_0183387968 /NCGR_PEP_ID=MMETSP0370-20130417/3722_1 /TAXON_ID=268820 /ORGANISM="Peridinium aciculiferum, Strain PAER-2" /LENGTH=49 /DNA_ID= /DNA_START= /DNA_END= /DNA_ORIENTATION=
MAALWFDFREPSNASGLPESAEIVPLIWRFSLSKNESDEIVRLVWGFIS